MKKIITILVFSLMIVTLFTSIDAVEPLKIERTQVRQYGSTLKVAIHNDIETLNPLAANDVWTWKVLGRIYETPILVDPEGKAAPHIAIRSGDEPEKLFGYDWNPINGEYNPRNITVTYNFTGVMFHDGVQMTIDDIIFSYYVLAQVPMFMGDINCLKDKNGESGSNFTATHWLGLTKINDTALHFNLSTNFTLFFEKTLAVMILPQHIWDQFGNPTLLPTDPNAFNLSAAQNWDNPNPIGSGPFEFIEWSPGLHINLTTYLDYCEGRNLIDGILFRIYKTADAAVMALKGGDVDYVAWSIVPDWIDDLITKRNVSLSFEDYPFFSYLSFNMRKSPCNDTAFRRAVAHCVNKDLVVDALLQNYGVVGDGPVSPNNTHWYNTSLPQYLYDLSMASQILEFAGYWDVNGDGWRDMPDGSPINIEILTPAADYDPILSAVGLMIASNMQHVGINAKSKPMMFSKLLDARNNHSFDMYILEWGLEELNHWNMKCEDPDYLYDLFYSVSSEKGKNYHGYNNTVFDQKILFSRTKLNETTRRELINETQGILSSDLPNVYLFYRTNIEARRSDRFINWEVVSSTVFNYWSLHRIYLKSDFIPPSAITWSPTESLVSPDTNFTVKWNETMDWGSVNDSFSYTNGTYVWTSTDGVFFHNPLTNTSTFNPADDLNPNTTYTVMFNSTIATDVEENKLDQNKNGVGGQGFSFGDDLVWSFTTKEVILPTITDVTATPELQEVYDYVNISANVSDNVNVDTVWVNITDPDGNTMGNFTMTHDPINDRYYKNQTYDIVGTYQFIIWANDTSNNWNFSSGQFTMQDTIPPATPTGLTIADVPNDEGGALNITWNLNTDDIVVYSLNSNKSGDWQLLVNVTHPQNWYVDIGLSNNVRYYYKISAWDEVPNESPLSEVTYGVPADNLPPATPTSLVVTSLRDGDLNITWNLNTDDTQIYSIYSNKTDTWMLIANVTHPQNWYVDTGLTSGITYYYKISAWDEVPLESSKSEAVHGISSPMGTISGTVKDKDGNPIEDANVTIYVASTMDNPVSSTTTNNDGEYSIDISPGTYDVKIERSGYKTQWKKDVDVTADQTTITDFTLPFTTDIMRDYWWLILLIIIIIVILIMRTMIVKKKKVVEEVDEGEIEKIEEEKVEESEMKEKDKTEEKIE